MAHTMPVPLAAAFIDIADTMVDDFDVVDLLHRVTEHCVNLLDVAAAGILLTDGQGNLRLLASSDERARVVELFQLQSDQDGPCLECFRTGRPVVAVNLPAWADRWPGFVTEAERQGFHSVRALPMRLRQTTIGGLNLFRTSVTTPLSDDDAAIGQALADLATIAILQQRALSRSETVVEQLEGALHSRVVIEQAKGALSYRAGIDVEHAFDCLRRYARAHNRLLAELAREVVTDTETAWNVIDFAQRTRPARRHR